MHLNKLALALSLAALALPMSAMAEDTAAATTEAPAADAPAADAPAAEAPASNLSWNFSLTTDYVFRGITQTDRKPAAQGGFDYTFGESGWAVGTWGSNVDFGSGGPDLEIDTYISWGHDLSSDWNVNLMLDRYNYVGYPTGADRFDYNEFIGKLSYKGMITLTTAYSNNYAQLDITETYVNLGGKWDVGHGFNVNAGFGHTNFSDGVDGYSDWNLGISKQCGPVNIGLNYFDTDTSGPRLSDEVVLSFAFGG